MYKIAVLGAGRIGKMHIDNLAAHPDYDLQVVYDAYPEVAERAVSAHPGVRVAKSDQEVFTDYALDAILLATPVSTHTQYILESVKKGIAILCEKPLGTSSAELRKHMDTVQSSGVPFQVGFNRRFDPSHHQLIQRVRAAGGLHQLLITSRDPDVPSLEYLKASGGLFMDMMIHDFDLALSILPEPPTSIYVVGSCLIGEKVCQQADDIDTAMATLRTDSGVMCHISCSRRAAYGYDQRIEAFGDYGMYISDNPRPHQLQTYSAEATTARTRLYHFFIERYVDSYRLQLDAFAKYIKTGKPQGGATYAEGYRSIVLAEAALRSMQTNTEIKLTY